MAATAPYNYLAQVGETIRGFHPGMPAREKMVSSWSGIGFKILGQRLIAPLGEVAEMLPVPTATRLPGVQPWILGLANVRGRLIPLFDLEQFFGGALTSNRARHRVLVMEMGDLYAGLVVSEVFGLQYFPENLALLEVPESVKQLAPFSRGAYEYNELVWTTFSPFGLVSDPRFFNAAAA